MMNPDDHSGHDPDLRGGEPPGDHGDYGAQGGPAQLGIIFPAQAQVTSVHYGKVKGTRPTLC